MTQGILPFKYEEAKDTTGMTSLGGVRDQEKPRAEKLLTKLIMLQPFSV